MTFSLALFLPTRFLAKTAAVMKARAQPASVAAIAGGLCLAMGQQQPARAASDYCQVNSSGAYVCIQRVFGKRSYRGIQYTINGSPYIAFVNCYQGGFESSSIAHVACWQYSNFLSDKPDPKAANAKPTEPGQMNQLLTNGKPSSSNKISPEASKQALPPEMK